MLRHYNGALQPDGMAIAVMGYQPVNWLIVGLGNPGSQYACNRHNIGFMALDALQAAYGPMVSWRRKFKGEAAEITIDGQKCLLLKPQTFMNLSGDAVGAACQFYKITPQRVLVIHDELDLPFGRLRSKKGGGHGGHNGLRSIDAHIGTDYYRLRLGIGHPGDKNRVSDYVLHDFSKTEQTALENWFTAITKNIPLILSGKDALFQTRMAPPPAPRTKKANGAKDDPVDPHQSPDP